MINSCRPQWAVFVAMPKPQNFESTSIKCEKHTTPKNNQAPMFNRCFVLPGGAAQMHELMPNAKIDTLSTRQYNTQVK